MPFNVTPDTLEAKIIDLTARVKALETSPALNAASSTGTITVNSPGQIQLNPAATGMVLSTGVSPFGGPQAGIQFTSQYAGVTPPFIAMQDGAGGGVLYVQSGPGSAYTYLTCGPSQIGLTTVVQGPPANYTSVLVNNGNVVISFPQTNTSQMTLYGDSSVGYIDFGTGWGRLLTNLVPEIRCVANASLASYIPIRASAFTVSSARATKEEIHDLPWKALDILDAAPVQRWRYKEEHAGDRNFHISPMADDLPEELVIRGDDGEHDISVDQRDLVGVLWEAVRELRAEVAELRAQLEKRA